MKSKISADLHICISVPLKYESLLKHLLQRTQQLSAWKKPQSNDKLV